MRQFRFPEIVLAVEGMVKNGITDEGLGARILAHVKTYMNSRPAATVRLTTACALILEGFQLFDS
jgi:hypothetical protein